VRFYMYTYTLGFIKKANQILMLNRNKTPWMGVWNGLGGKLNEGESPILSMQRELFEEMGKLYPLGAIIDRGILTWESFDAKGQGLYLFLIEDDTLDLETMKVEEGILDFKSIDWILDEKNRGIADNIPFFLNELLTTTSRIHVHCIFEEKQLKKVEVVRL
jgi:8-oxo-dGTP diphosphatase